MNTASIIHTCNNEELWEEKCHSDRNPFPDERHEQQCQHDPKRQRKTRSGELHVGIAHANFRRNAKNKISPQEHLPAGKQHSSRKIATKQNRAPQTGDKVGEQSWDFYFREIVIVRYANLLSNKETCQQQYEKSTEPYRPRADVSFLSSLLLFSLQAIVLVQPGVAVLALPEADLHTTVKTHSHSNRQRK